MKQTILVVDDDKEVVRLMRAYLEKAGYAVLVAYNGENAAVLTALPCLLGGALLI